MPGKPLNSVNKQITKCGKKGQWLLPLFTINAIFISIDLQDITELTTAKGLTDELQNR